MGGLMSWESAKRELESLYRNPDIELSSMINDSSSYILGYEYNDMQTTRIVEHEHGYVNCPHCEAITTDVDFETTQLTCWDCKKEVKLI